MPTSKHRSGNAGAKAAARGAPAFRAPRRQPRANGDAEPGNDANKVIMLRRLTPADVHAYRQLRLRGLRESPTAFGRSYREEKAWPLETFLERLKLSEDTWVLGAFADARLVGVVGLVRDQPPKARHKAAIYGMYVDRRARRNGIGRALLAMALQTAEELHGLRQVRLCVTESNRAALKLYHAFGFTVYGREKAALCVAGRYYAELLLARRLRPRPSA